MGVWAAGGRGGVVSCFHVGDSFVDMRGGLYVLIQKRTHITYAGEVYNMRDRYLVLPRQSTVVVYLISETDIFRNFEGNNLIT